MRVHVAELDLVTEAVYVKNGIKSGGRSASFHRAVARVPAPI